MGFHQLPHAVSASKMHTSQSTTGLDMNNEIELPNIKNMCPTVFIDKLVGDEKGFQVRYAIGGVSSDAKRGLRFHQAYAFAKELQEQKQRGRHARINMCILGVMA
jgi:hypothetical protein